MPQQEPSIDPLVDHLGQSLTALARRAVALYAPVVAALSD
jgi:hypothetical protein